MSRVKESFMYWQENVATDEELCLPFEEQIKLVAIWQAEYHEYLADTEQNR